MIRRVLCIAVLATLAGLPLPSPLSAQLLPAGVDRFEAIVEMSVEIGAPRPTPIHLFLTGPVVVQRSDAQRLRGGGLLIQTEILSMDLVGTFTDPGGPGSGVGPSPFRARLTESASQQSIGEIRTSGRILGGAESFFDVFLELEIGGQTLTNVVPIRLEAVLVDFPRFTGSGYRANLPTIGIDLSGGGFSGKVHAMTLSPAQPSDAAVARQVGPLNAAILEIQAALANILSPLSVNISGTLTECPVSGGVPVPGVEFWGLNQSGTALLAPSSKDTTDENGAFSFNVPSGSSGGVFVTAFPLAQPDKPPLFSNLQTNLVINFTTAICQ